MRPEEDRLASPAVEPALGALETLVRQMEPLAVSLDERPAAVVADPPAGERAERVADRSRGHHDRERLPAARHLASEDDDVLAGERAGGERARVEHHELAGRGQHRVDEHQREHGVDAVVADERRQRIRDRRRDRGDEHLREYRSGDRIDLALLAVSAHGELRRQRDGACRVLRRHARHVRAPSGRRRPCSCGRPTRRSPRPACSVTAGVGRLLTTVPDGVSIREVTEAARASSNCATTRVRRRGTESAGGTALAKPSVVLRENGRSNDDGWPRSSVALTTHRQGPSGSRAPSAVRPVHVNGYVPGAAWPEKTGRAEPSGATRFAVTVDGRTSL